MKKVLMIFRSSRTWVFYEAHEKQYSDLYTEKQLLSYGKKHADYVIKSGFLPDDAVCVHIEVREG